MAEGRRTGTVGLVILDVAAGIHCASLFDSYRKPRIKRAFGAGVEWFYDEGQASWVPARAGL